MTGLQSDCRSTLMFVLARGRREDIMLASYKLQCFFQKHFLPGPGGPLDLGETHLLQCVPPGGTEAEECTMVLKGVKTVVDFMDAPLLFATGHKSSLRWLLHGPESVRKYSKMFQVLQVVKAVVSRCARVDKIMRACVDALFPRIGDPNQCVQILEHATAAAGGLDSLKDEHVAAAASKCESPSPSVSTSHRVTCMCVLQQCVLRTAAICAMSTHAWLWRNKWMMTVYA